MKRKATAADILQERFLRVLRDDGTTIVVDLRPYLGRGVFRALQDPEFAAKVSIDALGGAEWPNGASLPPELLAADHTPAHEPIREPAAP